MMSQYSLSYRQAEDYSAENYFVSASNEEAYRLMERWPDWGAAYGLYVYGEEGSGKTHLAELWRRKTDGDPKHVVIDGLEQQVENEAMLFHQLNNIQQQGGTVFCTARTLPMDIGFKTRDVQSRLMGMLQVKIQAPDEALLAMLLTKHFADRQLKVAPEVIDYAVPRMERSYRMANRLIEALDNYALENRREITIPLVREVMSGMMK